MMELGIFAKTFAGQTAADVLRAAGEAGYACVQYNMACSGLAALPTSIEGDVARGVSDASQQTGVGLAGISATYNMAHPNPAQRVAGRKSFSAIAAQAGVMGSRLLTVCSGSLDAQDQWRYHPNNGSAVAWRDMLGEFELLLAIAEQHDVLIGVEPELANIVSTAEKAVELLNRLQSPRIKIILDPANLAETATADERRSINAHAIDALAPHIAMAHAKDRTSGGAVAAPGQGVIDFAHFTAHLRRAGFHGPVVAHGFEANKAIEVANFLRPSMA